MNLDHSAVFMKPVMDLLTRLLYEDLVGDDPEETMG